MQTKPFARLLLALIIPFLLLSSCKKETEEEPQKKDPNIVALAQSVNDLSTLVQAIKAAKLTDALSDEKASFTVFAPTNAAFEAFLKANNFASLGDIPDTTLVKVLQYHVVQGAKAAAALTNGSVPTLLTGSSLDINVDNGVVINDTAKVTVADNKASNGIVHIIDQVLVPPSLKAPQQSIVDIVKGNDNFSILLSALTKYPDVVTSLSGAGPFTVFAPDNDAFAAFLAEDDRFDALEDIPEDVLKQVLLYHVIAAAAPILSGDLPAEGESPATLEGSMIAIKKAEGAITLDGRVNVRTGAGQFDISASNGVIHTIDNVLLPPAARQQTIAAIAIGNENLSLLVAALKEVPGLLETTSNADANITVFAPTNDAFMNLLTTLNKALGANYEAPADVPAYVLERVLKYHILGEAKLSTNLMAAEKTLEGSDIAITTTDGVTIDAGKLGEAKVVSGSADINAVNGVVHVIDAVLVPDFIANALGTVLEPAIFDPNGSFTTLLAAVETADLYDALTNPDAMLTVFAPTNAAFDAFIAANDDIADAAALLASPSLSNILLYHVLGTKVMSSDIPADGAAPAYLSTLSPGPEDASGDATTLSLKAGPGLELNGSVAINAEAADIERGNGVVHVIEGVLTPPTIVDLAAQDGRFTALVQALQDAELVETLQSKGAFTVFVPTDEAFDKLESVPTGDALTNVLLYHVASGNVTSGDLQAGDNTITTLTGAEDKDFVLNGQSLEITANNSMAKVIITDIQGTNGVIHVVDGVLLP